MRRRLFVLVVTMSCVGCVGGRGASHKEDSPRTTTSSTRTTLAGHPIDSADDAARAAQEQAAADAMMRHADAIPRFTLHALRETQLEGTSLLAADSHDLWTVTGAGLLRLDPSTLKVTDTVPVALAPRAMVVSASHVWFLDVSDGQVALTAVAPRTRQFSHRIEIGDAAVDENRALVFLAAAGHDVWLAYPTASGSGVVERVDGASGRVLSRVELLRPATALGATKGIVFVGDDAGIVSRLDAGTGRVLRTVAIGGSISQIAVDRSVAWVIRMFPDGRGVGDELVRVRDTSPLRVLRTGLPVAKVAVGGGRVWVSNYGYPMPLDSGFVGEVMPTTGRCTRATTFPTAMNNGPSDLAVDGAHVWALNTFTGTLSTFRA